MRALVVDVGSTSLRTAIVEPSGAVTHVQQRALSVSSPNPGEVELNANEIATTALELAAATISAGGPCQVVGIANQRATTVVFDVRTGAAVGPALGWQDLRTVIDCLVLQGSGFRFAPNQSATKAKWLLEHGSGERSNLRIGTLETFLAFHLSRRDVFVTDHSNAALTGLIDPRSWSWDEKVLEAINIEPSMLARLVPTMGSVGPASAVAGSPDITSLVGDQSASLFGQSCLRSGSTKITFGTGAMLDLVSDGAPENFARTAAGCFPVVARSDAHQVTWGLEGIVLSAGTCIEWLRDDLGLISSASETEALATSITSSDGVSFVPALLGLGTPQWDFGARGAFFGLTRGSGRAHLVRAVLEGIAQRGADLIDAASRDTGHAIADVRVDGGMSSNNFLLQHLANVSGATVSVSPEREATARGVGLMALVAHGELSLDDVEAMWHPQRTFEPDLSADERDALRTTWRGVVARAEKTLPDLSAVSF